MGSTSRRFSELNGYRGVAALLIVVFHAYQFSREGTHTGRYLYEGKPIHTLLYSLDTSVSWFFALSGFFLFLPYASALLRGQATPLSRVFLFHRALRIAPLYLLGILVVWCLRYTSQPSQWLDLLEHLSFTHIWDSHYIFYTIGPAWSLGDEVVYYAMLAVMGPLLYRLTRAAAPQVRQVWVTAFPLGLVVLSVVYKLFMHFGLGLPASGMAWLFNPLAHADSFGMGMMLASLSALGVHFTQVYAQRRLALGAFSLLALTLIFRSSVSWVGVFAFGLSALAFTLLMAATVLTRRATGPENASVLVRFLNMPVWVPLSTLSYGIYLWHEPLMLELSKARLFISPQPQAFWSNAALVTVLSVLLATCTYLLIERPLRSARNLMTPEGRLKDDYAIERLRYRLARYRARRRGPDKGGVA